MDCLEGLKGLPDEVVQCVVTSPPYWGLRDYGTAEWEGGDPKCNHMGEPMRTKENINRNTSGSFDKKNKENREFFKSICDKCGAKRIDKQVGLEEAPSDYIRKMVEIFHEVKRVLRKDGTLWLNIGDSYSSSPAGNKEPSGFSQTRPSRKKHGVGPETVDIPKKIHGLKLKDLMMMPARLAIALQEDGWWIRSDIIWAKENPMPESCKDRPTSSYEHIFLMTKSGTSQYWVHRDKKGSRKKPKPDYLWIDNLENIEYKEKPHAFNKEKMICPMCNGIGRTKGWYGEIKCELCEEDGEIKRWKRINLWIGHDYYYDADAIAEKVKSTPSDIKKMIQKKPRIDAKHFHTDPGVLAKASHRTNIGMKRAVGGKRINGNIPGRDDEGRACNNPEQLYRNKRNVWEVSTKPYSGAHFATYPIDLILPCILAGTSSKGCCLQCGAPWERVKDYKANYEKREPSHSANGNPTKVDSTGWRPPTVKQKGWQPTCFCGGNPIPCIVLDPFLGSGTTMEACRKNNRIGIGFELNPDYEIFIIKRSMIEIPRLETYFIDIMEENF